MPEIDEHVERASLALTARLDTPVEMLLTLGSGLGGVADRVEDPIDIPMAAVPGLPVSKVPGHTAWLRYGELAGRKVLVQRGRVHLYEGWSASEVARMVEVAGALGATTYVVTNAAGGLDPSFVPGDLMVLDDHLNLTGASPLTGVVRDGGPLFVDMADAYDPRMRALAHEVGAELGIELRSGVYAGLPGPAYETPAEVRMLRTMGADAVGMSTVLEVTAARAHGMRVLGTSSITNVHGEGVATSHEEVLQVGAQAAERLGELLLALLPRLGG